MNHSFRYSSHILIIYKFRQTINLKSGFFKKNYEVYTQIHHSFIESKSANPKKNGRERILPELGGKKSKGPLSLQVQTYIPYTVSFSLPALLMELLATGDWYHMACKVYH